MTSTDPDDLFAEVLKNNLEEEQEEAASKAKPNKGKEKARDENDYEDLDEPASFAAGHIVSSDHDSEHVHRFLFALNSWESQGTGKSQKKDSGYFSDGDAPETPLDQLVATGKGRIRQGLDALGQTSYGKTALEYGRSGKEHLHKMAEHQAPYNVPYADYERYKISQFEQQNGGVHLSQLPKEEQATIRNEWMEEYCTFSSNGFFSGVGQLIDDGFRYGGYHLGKGTARTMRQLGFEKATAQDTGRGIEVAAGIAGMFFNPLNKLGGAAKLGKVGDLAGTATKVTKAERNLQALDLASTVARPRINKPLREMTNAELVQAIANRAEYEIGGRGAVPGTYKHKYAERLLERIQEIFGDRGLILEQRWVNGVPTRNKMIQSTEKKMIQ